MPVSTIGIVRDCFYQFIFYFEKFSTWVWLLPLAVNVNLNLSTIETGTPRISAVRWTVDFSARRLRLKSRGFVCQTKKVNSRGVIPERSVGQRQVKSNNRVLCQTKRRNFRPRKVSRWKFFRLQPPSAIQSGREFKIQQRGRQRERQKNNRFNKQNNNFARASHFFVHFFPVFTRLRRENASFRVS